MLKVEKKVLSISLALTLVITSILFYVMQTQDKNEEEMVNVIVATADISAKELITDSKIKEINIPVDYATQGSIGNKKSILGKIAREDISPGEQIIVSSIMNSVEKDGLSSVIPDNYRAITIQVDDISSVGNGIRVGDYVDVMVFSKADQLTKARVYTLFQNIEVIAINLDNTGSSNVKYVTLCVKPDEAQKIFLANETGNIRFILRGVTDKKMQ